MRRRLCLVTALLLVSILLSSFAFEYWALAAGPKLIHVEGTYINEHPTTTNIVGNGGFESSLAPTPQGNWQVITSDSSHLGTVTLSPDAPAGSCSGAFNVTANPVNGGFVALSESTSYWGIGQSFALTFYYKSTLNSAYASVYAKSQATTVGSDITYWMSSNLPPTNTWTPVTLTFGPIPDGTVDLQIHFGPPEGATGSLWVDDVSTVAAANPVTPSPTPATPSPTPSVPATTSPTPTQTPTQAPTPTATLTPTPTANPTQTATGTPNPTNTQNPNPTQATATTQPSASADTTSPPQPEVLEVTIVAIAAVLLTGATLAIIGRKTKGKHSGGLAAAALASILVFSIMPCAVYAEQSTPLAPSPPVTEFSLWYTNGTAFPTDGTNANGTEFVPTGAPAGINIGGIHCVPAGYGSSRDQVTNIIVLRNDGNTPINVSLTLKNAVAPSNIKIILEYYPISNNMLYPLCSTWMGYSDVGKNPLAPGQYMWIAIDVILAQTSMPVTGTPNYNFNYSFDIEVTATQA